MKKEHTHKLGLTFTYKNHKLRYRSTHIFLAIALTLA